VDVFAPGVKIYSSIPGGTTYGNAQGTSMASPVVAGTAAFLLEYFPTLSAEQVKEIIEKTAQAPADSVRKPGSDEMVLLSDICKSGGVINAYEAAKLAYSIAPEPKPKKKQKKNRRAKSVLRNEQL
jgi:subtilisin family serine protease